MPVAHSTSDVNLSVNDIFDWLLSLYGFQVMLQIPTYFSLCFIVVSVLVSPLGISGNINLYILCCITFSCIIFKGQSNLFSPSEGQLTKLSLCKFAFLEEYLSKWKIQQKLQVAN